MTGMPVSVEVGNRVAAAVASPDFSKWVAILQTLDADVIPQIEAFLQQVQDHPEITNGLLVVFPSLKPLLDLDPAVLNFLLLLHKLNAILLSVFGPPLTTSKLPT